MRIFGYGSLIWRPAIPHTRARNGFIRGFKRRFWQGSTDHRGVPGAPGRVVTLLPEPDSIVWGRVFDVPADERDAVLARLDHREKGGYERHEVSVELAAQSRVSALMYVATPDNPSYLGPAPLPEIAAQVRTSTGPSGPNVEYVLELHRALEQMGAHDDHVFELAQLLS